nr:DMT family transporter [Psychromarinibacter sediminicola]
MPLPATPFPPSSAEVRAGNLRGLALMLLAFFLFSAVDAQAKYLTQTLHPLQVVWFRQLGLLVAVLGLLAAQGVSILRTAHPRLQLARGALAGLSAAAFIFGVSYVPLADAVAVAFIAPFMVTVLGALILREPVGFHRWAAVSLGFAGTLIVIRPGAGVVHPAILLVVLAASLFAARQIVSRYLAASDRTITTVAYTALTGSALLSLALPFVWQWPATGTELLLLAGTAILAGLGEFTLIKALEVGQAAVIAPMQYTMLLWGTFYGWLLFSQFPDGWTWVGAALIVASGLYTLHRERLAARRHRATG